MENLVHLQRKKLPAESRGFKWFYRTLFAVLLALVINSNAYAQPYCSSLYPTNFSSTGFYVNYSISGAFYNYYVDVYSNSSYSTKVWGGISSSQSGYFNVTGLAPGTQYWIRSAIEYSDGSVKIIYCSDFTTQTLLNPPVALEPIDVTSNSFTARWNYSTNATSYELQISTDPGFTTSVFNQNVGNTDRRSVTGLNPGTTYYYRVRAINSLRTSELSNVISSVFCYDINVTSQTVENNAFTINWENPVGANLDNYILTVSENSDLGNPLSGYNNISIGNVNTFTVNQGIDMNTNYYYQISGQETGTVIAKSPIKNIYTKTYETARNALAFDGTDDYVTLPAINLNSTNFTIEGWVKWKDLKNNSRIFDFGSGAGSNNIFLCNTTTSNQLEFNIYNGATGQALTVSNIIPLNSWVHIAAVASGGTMYLYVNGILVGTKTGVTIPNVNRTLCFMGKSNWGSDAYFKGNIDEFRIWNVARSQKEIRQTMERTLTGTETDLLAYYDFNTGNPSGTNTALTTLLDYSFSSNNGTLNNFALTGTTSNWIASEAVNYPKQEVFSPFASFTNGQMAEFVAGQPDFTTGTSGVTSQKLNGPLGITIDAVHGKMYVADFINSRVLRFPYPLTGNFPTADLVFGQPDFTSNSVDNGGLSASCFHNPENVALDANYNLWVTDMGNGRILRFSNPWSISSNKPSADLVIGAANFTTDGNLTQTYQILFDDAGNLWAANAGRDVVYRFNAANLVSGNATPDGFLGVVNSSNCTQNSWDNGEGICMIGTSLFVSDWLNNRVLRFDNAANKANSANADAVLGQTDFTSNTFGCNQSKFHTLSSMTSDGSGTLYVTDYNNHRVMIFKNAVNLTNGAKASGVLGHPDFTSASSSTTQSGMNGPRGIFYDKIYNKLLVTESLNQRVLQFGFSDNALAFDGANDYIAVTDMSFNGSSQISISAWVNITNFSNYGTIFAKIDATDHGELFFRISNNGKPHFAVCTNVAGVWPSVYGTTVLTPGEWYYITGTYDGTQLKMYVNGNLENTVNHSGTIVSSGAAATKIGTLSSGGLPFHGKIDEISIWTKPLNEAEIQSAMKSPLNGTESGLRVYYNFNNGIAGGTNTGLTILNDITQNGNNGTLNTFALTGSNSNWVESRAGMRPEFVAASGLANSIIVKIKCGGNPDTYLLTVSEDALLRTPITGYNRRNMGNGTEVTITGLDKNTTYYFDVWAVKNGQISPNMGINSKATQLYTTQGSALSFDGTDDYVDCGTGTSLNMTSAFTLEAWINPNHLNYHTIISKGNAAGTEGYTFYIWNGQFYLTLHNKSGYGCTVSGLKANEWQHVAVVWDGNNKAKFYRNGVFIQEVTAVATAGIISSPASTFKIGEDYCGSNTFNGAIDEVHVWNTARSNKEIRQYMERELTGTETGLMAYYNFNEETGTTAENLTVNNLDGTLTNGVLRVESSAPLKPYPIQKDFMLTFDGYNDYVQVAPAGDDRLLTQTFTASFWVKPDATQLSGVNIVNANATTANNWRITQDAANTNQYVFQTYENGSYNATTSFALPADEWSFVVVTRNGTNKEKKVYVNGVLKITKNGTHDITFSSQGLWLGVNPNNLGTTNWKGSMDEFGFYNKVLSLNEIKALYMSHQMYDGNCQSIYLPFDEDAGITSRDYSANDYPAVLVNGVKNKPSETPIELGQTVPGDLVISKGYYNTKVQVSWNVAQSYRNIINKWYIYRKVYGSEQATALVYSSSDFANFFSYDDNSCNAGVLYEYQIIGETDFGGCLIYTNPISSIGYRTPTGVVNGKVTYAGGIAVEGVKIVATRTQGAVGKSLAFAGNSTFTVAHKNLLMPQNEITCEIYVRPTSLSSDFDLIEKENAYGMYYSNADNSVKFRIKNEAEQIFTVSYENVLKLDTFVQISGTYDGTNIRLYANGIPSETVPATGKLFSSTENIIVGQNFTGNLDELRLWDYGKDSLQVNTDYFRILTGGEEGCIGYWRMDLGVSDWDFDQSNVDATFNGNNADLVNTTWATTIPSNDQLGLCGITNETGNYTISNIGYKGSGETFNLTPMFGVHQFDPNQLGVYIGDGAIVLNNQNFTDISSFTVKGNVIYKDTYFPVEGAYLYIDEQIVVRANGTPVSTDQFGNYEIQVPIGYHNISVAMQGHTFEIGRYPETGNYNFQQPINGINFVDNSLIKVVGKVAGGPIQAEKPIALGKTVNNLGNGVITITTQKGYDLTDNTAGVNILSDNEIYRDNVITSVGQTAYVINNLSPKQINIYPDENTGEFVVYLLPEKYLVTAVTAGNYIFDESHYITMDLTQAGYITETESDSTTILDETYFDVVQYNKNYDFIYRETPDITVTDKYGEPIFWETELQIDDETSVPIVDEFGNLKTLYPVFKQRKQYLTKISVFEEYYNVDKDQTDIVPVNDGKVEIQNFLAIDKEKNEYELNENGNVFYSFWGGLPNIAQGGIGDYVLTFNVTSKTGQNQAIATTWEPNGEIFKGYVLGGMPSGSNFVTNGPQKLITILRDPPGTGSTCTLEQGQSVTNSTSSEFSFNSEIGQNLNVDLGSRIVTWAGFGAGVITETEVVAEFEQGTTITNSYTGSNSNSTTYEATQSWSTSDSPDFVGADGDVFVGHATNIVYGVSTQVAVAPITQENASNWVGNTFEHNGVTYDIGITKGIRVNPEFGTMFMYSQYHIENYLIPNLKMVRNLVMQNNPDIYQCVICDTENPEYGRRNRTGNDVWNGRVGGDSYNVAIPADWNYSITFVDSVEYFNKQIYDWEYFLMLNEMEKVKSVLIENVSFDGGTTYEKSITNSSSEETTHEYEFGLDITLAGEVGFEIMGMGSKMKIETKTSFGTKYGETEETENSTSYSYTLADGDAGDYLSVDVRTPYQSTSTSTGPVFLTKGGQTSCPFEDAYVTKYYQPGTVLQPATMQREKPQMTVENAIVSNVSADMPALFNFQLSNISETEEDAWMLLTVDETSNQNGALIEMDGSPITNGRIVMLPAGQTINKTIGVSMVNPTIYDYENIRLVLSSMCDGNVSTDVAISAYFQPVCTRVVLDNPINQWVVNTNTDTTLNIKIKDYNLSNNLFDRLLVQYKPASTSVWATDMIYYVDEDEYNTANEPKMFINNQPTLNYLLDLSSMQDRNYDVRITSTCVDNTTNSSIVASGIKDVKRPMVFGTPQPGSGILNPGDDIMLTFDEPINAGALLPYNFSVRGVLNGNEIKHQACVFFNGTNGYASVLSGVNLDNKSWTIEFWAKRGTLEQGVIFAQDGLEIGFDADNKFYLKAGNQLITSQNEYTDTELWFHYAVTYNQQAEEFNMYVNDVIERTNILQTSTFTANGKMVLGKDLSDANYFNGYVHELRIWEKLQGFSTIYAQMYQELSGSEIGLSGYWTMNEAKGEMAQDKARNRHATLFGAEWRVFPTGFAREFDGPASVELNTTTTVIFPEMNFTLEFYFNAEPQTNTVLFSNGKGDGTDETPFQNIWVIGFDGNGKLYAKNNGVTILISEKNYTDNTWYHFALAVNRNANASIYIDGEMVGSAQASNFGGLSAAGATLGARRFYQFPNLTYDQHFTGLIDEFRLWELLRTSKQLELDLSSKLKGDEMGLLLYFPFDKYNSLGIDLIPTLEDITGNSVDAIATNGSETNINVPNLKDARPVQDVAFDWVVNEDKIIINLNEPAALIEKCILEFTVERVEDLRENRIASPVTWTAYIKQNTVVWDETEINIEKEVYEPYTFTTKILNMGGTNQTYSITGLPTWLSCSAVSGSLSPDSEKTLTFTVDPVVNVGEYALSLFLTSDFGYSEKLNVNVNVFEPAPDWTVNSSDFQYSMSVIGQLKIDGSFSANKNDKIAAFVNGQCRGVAQNLYIEGYDKFIVFLTIFSNTDVGENVSFKIWNASEGYVHTNVTPEISFVYNEIIGTVTEPQIIETYNSYSINQNLNSGWTWMSFNLDNADLSDVNLIMENINAQTGDQIKSQTLFANYSTNLGWDGSLVFGEGFNNSEMYMMKLASSNTLVYNGAKLNPEEIEIPINTGWNWIGFTPNGNMYLNDAFAYYQSAQNDIVKSQYQFAMYDNNLGWIGSLTYLVPGFGYMYKTSNPTNVFTYPNSGYDKGTIIGKGYEPVYGTPWTLKEAEYQNNMSLIATINTPPDFNISENNVIGVFAGNICCGIAKPLIVNSENLYFVTIYGNANENLTFKLIDLSDNVIYDITENLSFSINKVTGTIENPFELNIIGITSDINENSNFDFSVTTYPNPFDKFISISYNLPNSEIVKIELFNVLGSKISDLFNEYQNSGSNNLEFDGSSLSSGFYLLKIKSGDFIQTVNIVKK